MWVKWGLVFLYDDFKMFLNEEIIIYIEKLKQRAIEHPWVLKRKSKKLNDYQMTLSRFLDFISQEKHYLLLTKFGTIDQY